MPPEPNQNSSQTDSNPLSSGGAGETISPTSAQAGSAPDTPATDTTTSPEPDSSPAPSAGPAPAPASDAPAAPNPSGSTPQVIGPAMPFAADTVPAAEGQPAAPAPSASPAPTPSALPSQSSSLPGYVPPAPSVSSPTGGPFIHPMASAGGDHTPGKHHFPILLLAIVSVLVLVFGGSAFAYFGIYMSPSTVWKDSLSNTGKGYDSLITYLNTQSKTHYSGVKETGSFTLSSDGTNFDGSVDAQSYNNNATASVKLDLGVSKIDLEARTVPAGTNAADIYLQVNGIKSIEQSLGTNFGPQIDNLDGQWIVVDHNLIADLEQQLLKQQGNKPQLHWSDINSFLVSAGQVNQQYVFTTNPSKSVTTIVKTYGKETVDGHKTMHYKVGFVKANVKAYITAMCGALSDSGLGTYIKAQTGQAVKDSSDCKDAENSADQIKSSDTVDVWADVSHRILYKVRVSDPSNNPAQNFVDVGLNYTGGSSYPFFINEQNKDGSDTGSFSVVATLDSKANTLKAVVKGSDKGSSSFSLNGNFTVSPSNQKLSETAPAKAIPITTVINNLGLGPYLDQIESLSSGGTSNLPTNTPLIP